MFSGVAPCATVGICIAEVKPQVTGRDHSGVAQLAEHLTVNQRVLGSSPSPGAITAGHSALPVPVRERAPWSQIGHGIQTHRRR